MPSPLDNPECFDRVYTAELCCRPDEAVGRSASARFAPQSIPLATVETRDPRPTFLCYGVPGRVVQNLGVGLSFQGNGARAELYVSWLRAKVSESPKQLVVLADGGDMLFGGCAEAEMLARYDSVVAASGGAPVVFGAEFGLWPSELMAEGAFQRYDRMAFRRAAVLRAFRLDEDLYQRFHACPRNSTCPEPAAYRYLNAGWVMGPVDALLQVYERAVQPGALSDQLHLARYFLERPQEVTLDYTGSLVLNLADSKLGDALALEGGVVRNLATGTTQCFVHGNGSGKNAWRQLLVALHSLHNAAQA